MVPTDTMFGRVSEPLAGILSSTDALATARSVPLPRKGVQAGRADADHQGGRRLLDGPRLRRVLVPLAVGPAISAEALLTEARVDPTLAFGVLVAAGLYLTGVRRLTVRGDRWPLGRTVSFVGLGLGSIVAVTMSGLAAYDELLFSAHMVQHMVLTMVAPVFLALGAPVTLALRTLPRRGRDALLAVVHSRVAAFFVNPAFGWVMFVASPFVLYFSGAYEATLRSDLLHELLHVHFLLVGCAFFFPLLGLDPIPGRMGHAVRILLVATTLPFHAFLGTSIMGASRLLAEDHYLAVWEGNAQAALADQNLGGALLWSSGDLVGLVLLGTLLTQWMRASEREAVREDRRLDRLEADAIRGQSPEGPPPSPAPAAVDGGR